MRVIRPVSAELKFQCEAGGNAHRKVNAEELAPELGHVFINLFAGHHINRLHDDEQPRQPKRERYKQKVIERRDGELEARQFYDFANGHVDHLETDARQARTAAPARLVQAAATYAPPADD